MLKPAMERRNRISSISSPTTWLLQNLPGAPICKPSHGPGFGRARDKRFASPDAAPSLLIFPYLAAFRSSNTKLLPRQDASLSVLDDTADHFSKCRRRSIPELLFYLFVLAWSPCMQGPRWILGLLVLIRVVVTGQSQRM